MMGIVHGALRRDLLRARDAADTPPHPRGRQRRALGEHVGWLMDFLHVHHTGEDEGLWPAVRRRDPSAGALLDSLEADHRQIEPAAAALRAAAERYAVTTDDDARVALVTALDELGTVLFPHLDREVAEAMPVVSRVLTRAEWDAIEQEHYVGPKSVRELGFEGHWLLDDLDEEGRDVVVHTVNPVVRLVLLHGFARRYRRHVDAVWRPDTAGVASRAR
jgi:hypothetical protein